MQKCTIKSAHARASRKCRSRISLKKRLWSTHKAPMPDTKPERLLRECCKLDATRSVNNGSKNPTAAVAEPIDIDSEPIYVKMLPIFSVYFTRTLK